MPKVLVFEDKETRLDEVKRAMRETNEKRMYERYLCISLLLSEYSRKDIAQILDRGLDTIGTYIQNYCASGLEDLQMDYSPGVLRSLCQNRNSLCIRRLSKKHLLT